MTALLGKIFRSHRFGLILLLLIQWYTFTFNRHLPVQLNAFVFMGSSLLFGIVLLRIYYNKSVGLSETGLQKGRLLKRIISLGGLSLIALSFYLLNQNFTQHEILAKQSDVIPTIIELCERFTHGKKVYTPIEHFGYYLPVTYLPMQWMPFLMAEVLHFDYRWIPIVIWAIAFIILVRRSMKYNSAVYHLFTILFGTIPVLLMSMTANPLSSIMADTVEIMVAGYYILLILSFNINSPVLRGLIVGICLMSRYSLVLWLPLAVVVLWISEPKRNFYITAATILIFILGIYVLPFLSKDWGIFYRGYKHYDISAFGEWEHINEATGKPYHLYSGFGFASFIYEYYPNPDLMAKIKVIQGFHFWGSVLSTVAMIIIYFRIRKNIHYKIFLMGSFKIYLAIFMFFIQVPYTYLMLVDLFVTIAIFAEVGKYHFAGTIKEQPAKQELA